MSQSTPKDNQGLIRYLERDPLRHIVHLKMLALYGAAIKSYFVSQDNQLGCLLLLPTSVSAYDTEAYPQTDYVVLMSATEQKVMQPLLEKVPTTQNLIFKFVDWQQKNFVQQQLKLERVTSFISYTSVSGIAGNQSAEVMVSHQVTPNLLPLFAANGYSPQTVVRYFEKGQGRSFAYHDAGDPVSACLAYHNYGRIWEIGALYTIKQARRQGIGQKVVASALAYLAENKFIPRYQVHEDNHPSQRLAKKLGMREFLTMEHDLRHVQDLLLV